MHGKRRTKGGGRYSHTLCEGTYARRARLGWRVREIARFWDVVQQELWIHVCRRDLTEWPADPWRRRRRCTVRVRHTGSRYGGVTGCCSSRSSNSDCDNRSSSRERPSCVVLSLLRLRLIVVVVPVAVVVVFNAVASRRCCCGCCCC